MTDKTDTAETGVVTPPRPIAMATGTGASICAASTRPKASMSRTEDQDGAGIRSSEIPSVAAKPISSAIMTGAASTSGM